MSIKPIEIDLSGLQSQFGLAANEIDKLTEACVNTVAISVYNTWSSLAKQELNSTAPQYLQNLLNVDKGRFEKQIVLSGVLPNMLEQGANAFDIKMGFSKSPKAKHTIPVYSKKTGKVIKKSGWYLTIPFRIGTPGALGQAGFSSVMPKEVYSIVKKMGGGGRLTPTAIPEDYRAPQSRQAVLDDKGVTLFESYQHKSSIYSGLTRMRFAYNSATQSMYGTFRRASSNSDKDSWIHRGLPPRNFAKRAIEQTDVETIVENEVMEYLENVL